MNENRRVVRWKINLPVRYAGQNTPAEGVCHTLDVSKQGAQLAMVEKHKLGDRLAMVLEIPGNPAGPMCVEADVVWQKASCDFREECNYLTGVVFRKIRDCHKQFLIDYVHTNYPQEFRDRLWDGV